MKSAHIGFVCKTFGELDETIKGKQQSTQLSSCILSVYFYEAMGGRETSFGCLVFDHIVFM